MTKHTHTHRYSTKVSIVPVRFGRTGVKKEFIYGQNSSLNVHAYKHCFKITTKPHVSFTAPIITNVYFHVPCSMLLVSHVAAHILWYYITLSYSHLNFAVPLLNLNQTQILRWAMSVYPYLHANSFTGSQLTYSTSFKDNDWLISFFTPLFFIQFFFYLFVVSALVCVVYRIW